MNHGVLTVFEDAASLQRAAVDYILEIIQEAPPDEPVRIAFPGGSTPRPVCQQLAQIAGIDWSRVHIYFGDERTVGPEDKESNYRMVNEALLAGIPIRDDHVHRMRGEIDPARAAAEYERVLRETFCLNGSNDLPRFDLILLGMGADGHTASLFPGTQALEETSRLVVANQVPQLLTTRITLTYPVLNAARNVCFLVTGEDKAEALRDVFEGDGTHPPAARVQPTEGTLRWFVDRPAAQLVS